MNREQQDKTKEKKKSKEWDTATAGNTYPKGFQCFPTHLKPEMREG
jgi:hypothetical protein